MTNKKVYQELRLYSIRLGLENVFMSSSVFNNQTLDEDNVDALNEWSEN